MITLPEYTVMGEDGKEYGPVSAEQILAWIAEGRLEKKTPVKPADAKDWVFVGSLPEFAGTFDNPAPAPPKPTSHRLGISLLVIVIVLVAAVIYVLVKLTPH